MKSFLPDVDIPKLPLHVEILNRTELYGDRRALVCGETGRSYTYHQMATLCRSVASGLVKLGVGRGTIVAILSPNIPEYAFFLFGVLGAGATATTLNPSYTPAEIAKHLISSDASIIITINGYEETVDAAAKMIGPAKIKKKITFGRDVPGYEPFTPLMADDGTAYPHRVTYDVTDHVAVIPFSSGTTGLPKGVMLTHHNIVANLYQNAGCVLPPTMHMFDREKHETVLGVLPFFHSFGLICILCQHLRMGSTIVTMRRFHPDRFLQTIHNYRVSALILVPPMVLFVSKDPRVSDYDLTCVKMSFCGAAPLSQDLITQYRNIVPGYFSQGYGLTEASPSVLGPIFIKDMNPGSCGYVVPNTEVKLIDNDSGEEVKQLGSRGELLIKGPQVMKGYYNHPLATAQTIDKQGWLHTGDVACFDKDGNVYVVDRIKELIKYKGFQVAPAELEALLLSHVAVTDAAVIGVPDFEAGELPRAYVIPKAGYDVTAQDIHNYVRENAAGYKQLRGGIVFTDHIPKSPSGKILRRRLREMVKKSKL